MSDMEGLKASVLEQSREKGELKWRDAQAKLAEELQQQKEQLQQEKENYRRNQLNQLNRNFQREEQQIRNQERQSTLTTKQNVLKELFQAAKEKMTAWSEKEQLDFIKTVLAQYADKEWTLVFGQLTMQKLSETSLQELASAYPRIHVASETIAHEAGFVVSDGQVDYNYLYDSLVDSVWDEESFRIANTIFTKD